jgi:hypothetical protein
MNAGASATGQAFAIRNCDAIFLVSTSSSNSPKQWAAPKAKQRPSTAIGSCLGRPSHAVEPLRPLVHRTACSTSGRIVDHTEVRVEWQRNAHTNPTRPSRQRRRPPDLPRGNKFGAAIAQRIAGRLAGNGRIIGVPQSGQNAWTIGLPLSADLKKVFGSPFFSTNVPCPTGTLVRNALPDRVSQSAQ